MWTFVERLDGPSYRVITVPSSSRPGLAKALSGAEVSLAVVVLSAPLLQLPSRFPLEPLEGPDVAAVRSSRCAS